VFLVFIAPLRLTLWVVAITTAVILVLIAIGVREHAERARAARRRERVRSELEPVFSRFLETEDSSRLAEELRPAFVRMDAAHRPVAAVLVTEVMHEASWSQRERLRSALEQAGIVELGNRGTRRLSPWRRALACEMLGKIGSTSSVPVLLERLKDRRPEVRMAAVRALGDIRSDEAVPALSEAFLARRAAPTNVVNDSLRRIGGESAPAFEKGIASTDPIVRVSSCFGLSGIAESHGGAVHRLAVVLATDADARVRAAAAHALGIVGGGNAPPELIAATCDSDVHVRRSAVKALGSFDDPATCGALNERTEDEDREVALRAAEALVALTRRPRGAAAAGARVASSSAWAVEYAQKVAEVVHAREVAEVSA
ncbi:MAG: HEAT repeat domain-containing protein, partial [Solirubrobacterales bacterium]|nr:HEAT repeat domain-containing protein [Solirubrobacterales bacterium]